MFDNWVSSQLLVVPSADKWSWVLQECRLSKPKVNKPWLLHQWLTPGSFPIWFIILVFCSEKLQCWSINKIIPFFTQVALFILFHHSNDNPILFILPQDNIEIVTRSLHLIPRKIWSHLSVYLKYPDSCHNNILLFD